MECKVLKKLNNQERLTKDEIKEVGVIVKKVVSFLIKNDILMTPQNYTQWFELFCNIQENNQKLSDREILERYQKSFQKSPQKMHKIKDETIRKKLQNIASSIDEKLEQIINTIDTHNDSLTEKTQELKEKGSQTTDPDIIKYLQDILENLNALKNENAKLNEQLKEYYEEIHSLRQELQETKNKAEYDYLTKLFNRRKFEEFFCKLLQEYNQGKGKPFSLIMLDIDNFKKINDTYGHLIGDEVLKNLANLIKNFLHSTYIPARIGGEEFAILLPHTSLDQAKAIAERLRQAVEHRTIPLDEGDLNFTVSIGVTEVQPNDSMDTMIKRADDALYTAKNSGKNMVITK